MTSLPANINIAQARLPATYENAKNALANCASIDECQDWANKAEALASYAKMADDDSLRKMADRIQARAVRRCGELLKQYDARGGDRKSYEIKKEGASLFDPASPTRREVAQQAGISVAQQKTAARVANVPAATFEKAVESEAPPTVTKLAEMGKQARLKHETPPGFREATAALGNVERFARFCAEHDPVFVAGGVLQSEAQETRDQVATIDAWLDRFVISIRGRE